MQRNRAWLLAALFLVEPAEAMKPRVLNRVASGLKGVGIHMGRDSFKTRKQHGLAEGSMRFFSLFFSWDLYNLIGQLEGLGSAEGRAFAASCVVASTACSAAIQHTLERYARKSDPAFFKKIEQKQPKQGWKRHLF